MKKYFNQSKETTISQREINNQKIAFQAALESIVLLQNNNNVLPLRNNVVALYGYGARHTIKGGTGSGEVNERKSVSIFEGLINNGFYITNESWLDEYDKKCKREYKKWLKYVDSIKENNSDWWAMSFVAPCGKKVVLDDKTDTAIYIISRQAGEGRDKIISEGGFNLLNEEIRFIKNLKKVYKKTILVINSGSYMDLKNVDKYVDGIIFYCQPGMEGGNAFASLLKGDISFSGKLSDTWAKKYEDIPFGNEFANNNNDHYNEYYKEGIYVGYRYFDSFKIKPRYHFGFGMSYNQYELKTIDFNKENDNFKIKVEVTNKGNYLGKEVVQIYAKLARGKIDKEYQRLVGFAKTKLLKPNEKDIIEISFNAYNLASYDANQSSYVLEKGNYIIAVGNSSNNTNNEFIIGLDKDIIMTKNDNICPLDVPLDELVNDNRYKETNLSKLPKIKLFQNDIKYIHYDYPELDLYYDDLVDNIINKLSVEEMIDVCVGTGWDTINEAKGIVCAGTVGKTTTNLFDKGLINVNLSDGPAGLRLLKDYIIDKNNQIKKVNKKKNAYRQYCSAFPVGTCLAQTFNESLCYEIGKAVSKEMDEYNTTYWLAPAINIHRNPLCGRNFEYYSEDPLLAGKIASSIIKGVQSIDGNYATIKHFCCNNVELNRQKSNSHVSERTLREIYLKGFEIAIKESNCKSVMTSYNLVNGKYSSTTYDLCSKVLRNEWNFDGVVMTDWFSTDKEYGNNTLSIKAGNDLIMPGGKYYYNQILEDYKKGNIGKLEIERCAKRIIKSIVYSNVAKKVKTRDFC